MAQPLLPVLVNPVAFTHLVSVALPSANCSSEPHPDGFNFERLYRHNYFCSFNRKCC